MDQSQAIKQLESEVDRLKYAVRRYRAALEDIADSESASASVADFAESVLETPTEGVETQVFSVQDLVDHAIEKMDQMSKEEFRNMCREAGYEPADKLS